MYSRFSLSFISSIIVKDKLDTCSVLITYKLFNFSVTFLLSQSTFLFSLFFYICLFFPFILPYSFFSPPFSFAFPALRIAARFMCLLSATFILNSNSYIVWGRPLTTFQAAVSSALSSPLNPFLGSTIFLCSYARYQMSQLKFCQILCSVII